METEHALVLKAGKGDVEAFEKLINAHRKRIFNIAYNLTGNEFDAEDISQEAVIKAFKAIRRFRADASFSTWLYRIVRNTFLNECKKRAAKCRRKIVESENFEKLIDTDCRGLKQGKSIESQRSRKILDASLLLLPVKFRLPVVLYHLQGFTYEEIAGIYRVPVGTVKSRIYRGREQLRKMLSCKM